MSTAALIGQNLVRIHENIRRATRNGGRDEASVRLVAVTKYARTEWMHALLDAGQTTFGESRPQQLVERAGEFSPQVQWHLIGSLQRNKIRKVLPLTALIHSVDSLRLLEAVDRIAAELTLRPRVLLQVNVAGESQKHGFPPEELQADWTAVKAFEHVDVAGLMTMAPLAENAESARPVFRRLRELRDRLADDVLPLPELSMGMTGDYEAAIEEGATLVRIGSGLFEGLNDDAP